MRTAKGKLTIDLGALRDNYNIIRARLAEGCRASAVLKANAYGLGAEHVARALIDEGCEDFFVASLDEALALRAHFSTCRIMILNGFYDSGAELYIENNLIPVLGSFIEIKTYQELAKKAGRALPAFLHFNTRMNRLGLGSIEADELLGSMDMLDGIEVQGVMSHFACADEKDHPMNAQQYEIFKTIAAHFPDAQKSLCNSSGIFRDEGYHFDLVRPGMALYGLNPTPEMDNPMHPVVSLDVPVIRTRIVYEGAVIGYGATYRFEKDTQLATVSSGYADGIFWSLANEGALYWKGYRCPIRGRISMDLTSVDLSAVPENERPKPGDSLEVIGPNQSPAQFGADAGSFDYEVLTSLGNRYQRHYVDAALNQSQKQACV